MLRLGRWNAIAEITPPAASKRQSAADRYDADATAQAKIATTVLLSSVNESDFDGVFYPGGHGPLWDLTDNTDSIALIESFRIAEKRPSQVSFVLR